MLSFVGTVPSIQAAQGQYVEVEQKFTSDISLASSLIRFNPALFIDQASKVLPTGHMFERAYTTGAMSIKDKDNNNYEATLTVIDNFNFKIKFGFLMVQDIGGYASLETYFNETVFDPDGNQNSVYRSVKKNIGFRVIAGVSEINHKIPISANLFFENYDNWSFKTGGKPIEGFKSGSDLEITYTGRTDIGNNYYFGLIRTDQIGGTGHFRDDYSLKYAFIDSSINQIADLSVTGISSAESFNSGVARITIAGSQLKTDAKYRAFIAFQLKGIWVSQLSEELTDTDPQNPITSGTEVVRIIDQFGNIETNSCASGLAPHGDVQVQWEIDKATFNADLTNNGISGTINDYFEGIEGFITNVLPANIDQDSRLGDPILVNVQHSNTKITAVVDVSPEDNYSGSKFVLLKATFNYGDYKDYQVQVFQLSYDAQLEALTATIKDPDGATVDLICQDSVFASSGDFKAEFSGVSPYKAFASVNGGDSVESDIITDEQATYLNFDKDKIAVGSQVCLFLVKDGSTANKTCEDCDDLAVFIQQSMGDNSSQMIVDIIASKDVNMDILVVNQVTSKINHSYTVSSQSSFQQTISVTPGVNKWGYFVKIMDGDCTYSIRGIVLSINTEDGPYASQYQKSITANENPCGLNDAATTCNNTTSLDVTCNPTTHAITIAWNDSFFDTSASDESSAIVDGATPVSPAPLSYSGATNVIIKRKVTFSNGCVLEINQPIKCILDSSLTCNNSRDIEATTANDELSITVTDSFTSTTAEDKTEYTLDGGTTWKAWTGTPVPLDKTELIRARTFASFTDGCPDIYKEIPVFFPAPKNYTPYNEIFEYGDETGNQFTITVNNGKLHEANPQTYFLYWRGQLITNQDEMTYTISNGVISVFYESSPYTVVPGDTFQLIFFYAG